MTRTLRLALTCAALAGCNNDVKLEPIAPPPQIKSFKASMGVVARGAMVTLEWDTLDALTIDVTQVGVGAVAGVNNKATGSAQVVVNAESLFVLSAINKRGVKVTALATVGVLGAGAKASFAAVPELIAAGGAATLVWNAPGAKVITITPLGGAALDLKGQGDLGSIEVKPAATTAFTLSADGTQKVATVSVAQALVSFATNKAIGLPGETVTLTWKTTGATKVIVGSPGLGALKTETDPAKMADGSLMTTLPDASLGTVVSFTLTVEGAGAAQTQRVAVVLSKLPEIKTFTGPEYARLAQKLTLGWATANADLVELSTGAIVFWTSTSAGQAAGGTLALDTPAVATEYTLTARSSLGGAPVTRKLTVKPVGAVSVTAFTATPMAAAVGGDAVTLSWNVPNARRLRIVGSDGHTVATARGPLAETGMATAYPNAAITYTLDADNTLEAPITATKAVTVTAPAAFGPATGAPVFSGNPVTLAWTVGPSAPIVGYPHSAIVNQPTSTAFVDIAASGAPLTFASTDNAIVTFTPKDFESFIDGNRVTGPVTVSTNGFFVFGATALTRATTVAIPNPTIERNFIAPFWADLDLGGGKVYWEVIGEAPERTLVVQFDGVKVKADPTSELTFEAKVHQTGVVSFEYKRVVLAALPTLVIGVQGAVIGVAGSGAATSAGLTFFGPLPSPLMTRFATATAQGGFLKLAGGYLKAAYTPSPFIGAGAVAITEVMFQPRAAIATTGEWLEVANSTATPIDLNGWTLDFGAGSTHTIATSTILPANGILLLGQSASGAANDNVATAYAYGTSFALAEPAGSVSLKLGTYGPVAAWTSGTEGVSVSTDPYLYLVSTDTAATAPHALTCASTASFGTQTPLQLGTPGTRSGCFGYARQSIPVSFRDISATGTSHTPSSFDEAVIALDLSAAPFTHFGVAKSAVSVSTNGWLAFKTTTTSSATNRTFPSTSVATAGAIAPFWDDLGGSNPNSGIHSKRIAAGEDVNNPLAHWIIQWTHYSYWSTTDDMNFQVKLFDSGVIEFHYGTMTSSSSSNYAAGTSATVWLENPTGSTAMVSSINQPLVVPQSAIRFTP